jgi:hypothetical protein
MFPHNPITRVPRGIPGEQRRLNSVWLKNLKFRYPAGAKHIVYGVESSSWMFLFEPTREVKFGWGNLRRSLRYQGELDPGLATWSGSV